jgi:flagellar biosynthesis GTPase FlhF
LDFVFVSFRFVSQFTGTLAGLWVFKKAEELGIVRSIDVYVTYGIEDSKFTTTSDGKYVRIRGGSPGGKEWQSLEENAKEQKRQEVKQQRERKREQQMEIERQQREREQQMEIERQQREREQQMEIERQQRVREQQMEIERQRRVREQQMEIERQQRNKYIVIGLIVSFIVIYLGMRHHHSN